MTTEIHFKFDDNVEKCVQEFVAEISPNSSFSTSTQITIPSKERMVAVKNLAPGTHYSARILTVYNDKQKVWSEICTFTTPSKLHAILYYQVTSWHLYYNVHSVD